ncbi:flagellar hook-associated protein 2 [Breoghania corrubedonensis]|uniref:Flagellar hook-associated protein 2 n=1 Tax=Breoghania corrubedonensis TaxID=665038 RepID=A0A2T5V6I0_9HYPH|nr:flagellar filament capping protein FliD [Breoghania corrubedonensis]PTW59336.1 flagellar hook-associated protein 2 [Breoghania corrubedonensis]
MSDVSSTTAAAASSTSATSYTYSSNAADIDWDALIEVAVAAKTAPADAIDVKITENETKIAAYEEMQDLLQGINDAATALRGSTGSTLDDDDVFADREAYLTSVGDVDAESAVVVTVDDDTDIGTYDLQILQLATVEKLSSAEYESNSEELGLAGSLTIALEDGEAVEFDITEDMSLAEIASTINGQSDTTGVQATVLKVSDDSYQLILSGTETGQEIVMSAGDGTDIAQALGITDENGDFANEIQAAQDAIITLDGITITRSSNTIDDVLDGVTFNLYQETGEDASISVEVSSDVTAIKEAIIALVDAYNAYREWAITQQEVSTSGTASDEATLFADSTLRSTNSSISDDLSTMIDSDSMALLGLSYDENNYLEYDESTLNAALLDDLDTVESLLTFKMDSSSNDIMLLRRNTSMPSELSLDITVDEDGTLTGVSVDGDTSLFTVDGSRIIGAEGSEYEGITLVFTGDESQTVDLTFSSGIAEQLFVTTDDVADEDDSILTDMIESLNDTNEDLEEKADDIRDRADTYEDMLTDRYAAYQAAIEEAESSLDYIEAILNLGND